MRSRVRMISPDAILSHLITALEQDQVKTSNKNDSNTPKTFTHTKGPLR